MGIGGFKFVNPRDPDNVETQKTLKAWIRQHLQLADDVVITLTEIQCAEPNCPDLETHIGLFFTDKTVSLRLRKPLVLIRKHDIYQLILLQ